MNEAPSVRNLGRVDYEPTWQAMLDFTVARNADTPDELWICEHPPVYTLGQAGKPEHLLVDNGIPLIKIDRGREPQNRSRAVDGADEPLCAEFDEPP